MTARLRPVPDPRKPVLIDPPRSGDWADGFRCGAEALAGELDAAYRRGLRNAPPTRAPFLGFVAAAFVVGFALALVAQVIG